MNIKNLLPLFSLLCVSSALAQNITGRITASDGSPLAGVPVSDGINITLTDNNGGYALQSDKKYGYVFYTLPSGYEPEAESNGWQPKIYALLKSRNPLFKENHDFSVKPVKNDRFLYVVGADAHLTNEHNDLAQFKRDYLPRLRKLIDDNPGVPVYSTILGDMSWDEFWIKPDSSTFTIADFSDFITREKYPMLMFPVTGNHDNDAYAKGEDMDMAASEAYRRFMSPSFYSYNLGGVHFVVLDDIVYINDGWKRNYKNYYTEDQLAWLEKDLALVKDKNTPVVIQTHACNFRPTAEPDPVVEDKLVNGSCDRLGELLKDFPTVHILTGHTHLNFHAYPPRFPNIHENNVSAIGATWWRSGYYTDRNIAVDGSPSGFALYEFTPDSITWRFLSTDFGHSEDDNQFRLYDMNSVKKEYKHNKLIRDLLKAVPTRVDYAGIDKNIVYLNVYNHDRDWKIEMWEGDKPLNVEQVFDEDPLHTITYDIHRHASGEYLSTNSSTRPRCTHLFKARTSSAGKPVRVKVTDSFGRVYEKTYKRPYPFNVAN